jgi:hypothetical protein
VEADSRFQLVYQDPTGGGVRAQRLPLELAANLRHVWPVIEQLITQAQQQKTTAQSSNQPKG